MGVVERQQKVREYRGQIPSPGRPTVAWRQDRVRFWAAIARGVKTEDAAAEAGVSSPVAFRWFRHSGGVNPGLPATVSGRYLSSADREEIALWRAQKVGVREIARRLGRSPSTISRELRRNASTRTYRLDYKASIAQWHAERRARPPKVAKLVGDERLRQYVQDRLAGVVQTADGASVGPAGPAWKGRNKPHRGDRAWVQGWSPAQIANRLPVEFPDDESMRISHEAIYQALYVQGRGALKRELVACLRTGRALRVPRARARQKAWAHVTGDVLLSARPAEAEDRAVPGHWEGDLIIGLQRSAIGTLVERTTRFTILVHLPREEGYGIIPRTKNGPALAGYGAIAMKNALAATMTELPEQLRRSLTWDRGKELSAHAAFRVETGIPVFFADPNSPWQRGTNENTNGLLRQYFPKGTDLSRWTAEEIQAVATALNHRPRKTLSWRTPPRSPRRTPTIPATSRRCDDRLNLPSIGTDESGGPITTRILTLDAQTGKLGLDLSLPTGRVGVDAGAGELSVAVWDEQYVEYYTILIDLKTGEQERFNNLQVRTADFLFLDSVTGFFKGKPIYSRGCLEILAPPDPDGTVCPQAIVYDGQEYESETDFRPLPEILLLTEAGQRLLDENPAGPDVDLPCPTGTTRGVPQSPRGRYIVAGNNVLDLETSATICGDPSLWWTAIDDGGRGWGRLNGTTTLRVTYDFDSRSVTTADVPNAETPIAITAARQGVFGVSSDGTDVLLLAPQ